MSQRISSARVMIVFCAVFLVGGCAATRGPTGVHTEYLERLYFGRDIGQTAHVTDSAWTVFLRDVVTPRFPDGFTTFNANGQWRDKTGTIIREGSFLLEVTHPAERRHDQAIRDIIDEYKRRFRQEAVLRVVLPAKISF
jgi:hypothetical protein